MTFNVCSSGFSRFRALPPKGGTTYKKAFTLIEVILAVVIAGGLLVVAISYYQRAADLRGQLLAESEKLTTIRLVHFRYFDGNEWLDAWNGVDLPMGVEVTFGTEAPAPEEEEEYGGEVFRRIIFVPAAKNSSVWEELP